MLLLLIAIAYIILMQSTPKSATPPTDTPSAIEPVATPTKDNAVDAASDNYELDLTDGADLTDETEITKLETIDRDAILNAELPETDSLAKEEVDRLNDEHQRMIEQDELATKQVAMNQQLTDMKAEQIKLLEQQIAQLEAEKTAKGAAQ